MNAIRSRVTFANVVSVISLFVALSGSAFAAVAALPNNSVGTAQLKLLAVDTTRLGNNAVTSLKVANDSLTGDDINEASLATVPSARNAETLHGEPVESFARRHGEIVVSSVPATSYVFNETDVTTRPHGNGWLLFESQPDGINENKFVSFPLSVPTTMYGDALSITSVKTCFYASDHSIHVRGIELFDNAVRGSVPSVFNDNARQGWRGYSVECVTLTPERPIPVHDGRTAEIEYVFKFLEDANEYFAITQNTVTLAVA